jgi:hypothetical protein
MTLILPVGTVGGWRGFGGGRSGGRPSRRAGGRPPIARSHRAQQRALLRAAAWLRAGARRATAGLAAPARRGAAEALSRITQPALAALPGGQHLRQLVAVTINRGGGLEAPRWPRGGGDGDHAHAKSAHTAPIGDRRRPNRPLTSDPRPSATPPRPIHPAKSPQIPPKDVADHP